MTLAREKTYAGIIYVPIEKFSRNLYRHLNRIPSTKFICYYERAANGMWLRFRRIAT